MDQDIHQNEVPAEEISQAATDAASEPESPTIEEQLIEATARADENLKGWQRVMADFENYKRRDQEHHAELLAYGQEQVLTSYIRTAEDLSLIMAHLPTTLEQVEEWKKGVSGVAKRIDESLREFGIERIATVGQKFNPELHEAVAQVDGEEDGIIAEEVAPGYKRSDKLLKPAQVKVFKKANQ
jgi:molecular chaperone GrpE